MCSVGTYARQRAQERIADLAQRGYDLVTFWREATEVIAPAVDFYVTPCFHTLDPASLLATSHYHEGLPEIPHAWLAAEYYADDFNHMEDVARSQRGIATLHESTHGDVRRSERYRVSMEPLGADQEVRVALRSRSGEAWGILGLYREAGRPQFDADELRLLRALSPHLAEGARRGLLIGEATDPSGSTAPGLVVLDDGWEVESLTPGVERWLADLPGGDWERGRVPAAVRAMAGRARRIADGSAGAGEIAFARALSTSGRWIVLHGTSLVSDGRRRTAVILEPTQPARITPLLMAAYGLTQREQEVTRLVLQGEATARIAERLAISPHTVQEHLKNIFEKTGVRTRRDLVGKVFFSHYEPRLRDNERRATDGRPVLGGPVARA
jgi:DNA-binding CsgD family transcriptional regulator